MSNAHKPNQDYNIVVDVDDDEPTLEFQDFATSNVQQGHMNTAGPAAPPYQPPGAGNEASQTNGYSIWQVEYWAQYFNVDSRDVVQRSYLAVVPKDSFLDVYNSNPDLWGTFWIPTSVIFAMFVTASMSQNISDALAGVKRQYDFTMLTFAVVTIYTYVFAIGSFVYGVTKYFGSQPALMECLSVYGYAMAVWIPISVLCVMPFNWFRWVMVSIGFASSGFFIMRSVNQIVGRSNGKLHKAIIPLLLVAHALLVVMFKLRFFSYAVSAIPGSDGGPGPEQPAPTATTT
ncbi:hypothetical protein LPJ72_001244 [Coemansia sp. Benny D160-2]|nr:hypothetical protein LPJ72_001244 [Coemansia sp. Benny D160-2]